MATNYLANAIKAVDTSKAYNSGSNNSQSNNVMTKDEFAKEYTAARQQGMSGGYAIKAISNGQTFATIPVNMPSRSDYQQTTPTYKQPSYQQPTYDIDKARKALQTIANTTTDRKLAKMINKYTSGGQKADDFLGQFSASFGSGKINELMNQAYGNWKANPTAENKAIADAYAQLGEYYNTYNAKALDDENRKASWLTKDMAQYAPQFVEQTKASAGKIAAGAAAGAIAGELLTPIPGVDGLIGAIAGGVKGITGGTIAGGKLGSVWGSTGYSYKTMGGAAAKGIMDAANQAGVKLTDEQVIKAANDEAIISTIIESADNAVDLILTIPGLGGMGKEAAKTLVEKAGLYLSNIGQEYGEEFTQEAISIANQRRALRGETDTGISGLLYEVGEVAKEIAKGSDEGKEAIAQMHEAGKGGGVIGAVMAPAGAAVNRVITGPATETALRVTNQFEKDPDVKAINDAKLAPGNREQLTVEAYNFSRNEDSVRTAQRGEATANQTRYKRSLNVGDFSDDDVAFLDNSGKPIYWDTRDQNHDMLIGEGDWSDRDGTRRAIKDGYIRIKNGEGIELSIENGTLTAEKEAGITNIINNFRGKTFFVDCDVDLEDGSLAPYDVGKFEGSDIDAKTIIDWINKTTRKYEKMVSDYEASNGTRYKRSLTSNDDSSFVSVVDQYDQEEFERRAKKVDPKKPLSTAEVEQLTPEQARRRLYQWAKYKGIETKVKGLNDSLLDAVLGIEGETPTNLVIDDSEYDELAHVSDYDDENQTPIHGEFTKAQAEEIIAILSKYSQTENQDAEEDIDQQQDSSADEETQPSKYRDDSKGYDFEPDDNEDGEDAFDWKKVSAYMAEQDKKSVSKRLRILEELFPEREFRISDTGDYIEEVKGHTTAKNAFFADEANRSWWDKHGRKEIVNKFAPQIFGTWNLVPAWLRNGNWNKDVGDTLSDGTLGNRQRVRSAEINKLRYYYQVGEGMYRHIIDSNIMQGIDSVISRHEQRIETLKNRIEQGNMFASGPSNLIGVSKEEAIAGVEKLQKKLDAEEKWLAKVNSGKYTLKDFYSDRSGVVTKEDIKTVLDSIKGEDKTFDDFSLKSLRNAMSESFAKELIDSIYEEVWNGTNEITAQGTWGRTAKGQDRRGVGSGAGEVSGTQPFTGLSAYDTAEGSSYDSSGVQGNEQGSASLSGKTEIRPENLGLSRTLAAAKRAGTDSATGRVRGIFFEQALKKTASASANLNEATAILKEAGYSVDQHSDEEVFISTGRKSYSTVEQFQKAFGNSDETKRISEKFADGRIAKVSSVKNLGRVFIDLDGSLSFEVIEGAYTNDGKGATLYTSDIVSANHESNHDDFISASDKYSGDIDEDLSNALNKALSEIGLSDDEITALRDYVEKNLGYNSFAVDEELYAELTAVSLGNEKSSWDGAINITSIAKRLANNSTWQSFVDDIQKTADNTASLPKADINKDQNFLRNYGAQQGEQYNSKELQQGLQLKAEEQRKLDGIIGQINDMLSSDADNEALKLLRDNGIFDNDEQRKAFLAQHEGRTITIHGNNQVSEEYEDLYSGKGSQRVGDTGLKPAPTTTMNREGYARYKKAMPGDLGVTEDYGVTDEDFKDFPKFEAPKDTSEAAQINAAIEYIYRTREMESRKTGNPKPGQAASERERRFNYEDMYDFEGSEIMQELEEEFLANRQESAYRTGKDIFDSPDNHEHYNSINKSNQKIQNAQSPYATENSIKRLFAPKGVSKQVAKAYNTMTKFIGNVAEGKSSFTELNRYMRDMRDKKGMALYANDAVVRELGKTAILEQAAYESNDPDSDMWHAFQAQAANAMAVMANRIDRVNRIDGGYKTRLMESVMANQKGEPKTAIGRAVNWLNSWQYSGGNFWRMQDGFDKDSRGIGYLFQKKHDSSVAKQIETTARAKGYFTDIKDTKGFREFANGKAQSNVVIGNKKLNMLQAVQFKMVCDTLRATTKGRANWSRLETIDGFTILDENGKKTVFAIPGETVTEKMDWIKDQYTQAVEDIEANEAASAYMKAAVDMFADLAGDLKEVGNEVNGTPKQMFAKGNYIPISYGNRSGEFSDWQLSRDMKDGLSNTRLMQGRTREEGGYVVVRPVSQTVDQYISQASNYIAFAEFGDELSILNDENSLAGAYRNVAEKGFGGRWGQWFDNYVKDMNLIKTEDPTGLNSVLAGARNKMMQGALVGSLSVIIKQKSSYWSAMGVLDPRAVMKAYSPIGSNPNGIKNNLMRSRMQGSSIDPDVSSALSSGWLNKLRNSNPTLGKLIDATNVVDARTVANVYKACIYDVAMNTLPADQMFKDGKKGELTDLAQFYVESKFEEALLNTQPIFTRQARAEVARTSNELIKMLSTFRTQQTQNLNRLFTTVGEYNAAKKSGNALTQSSTQKALQQTIQGQMMASGSIAALTILADMLLHKHKKYKDDDDELAVDKIADRWMLNSLEAATGTYLFAGDLTKWLIDEIRNTGEYGQKEFYGISMGPISSAQSLINAWSWLLSDLQKGRKHAASNTRYVVNYTATMMGVPVQNAYNIINSFYQYGKDVAGKDSDYEDALKEWDAYRTDYGNKFYNALKEGNASKAQQNLELMGDRYKTIIKQSALERLKSGESDDDEVKQVLMNYGDMFEDEADKEISEMHYTIDTGYSYDSMRNDWKEGKISSEDAIKYRQKYGGQAKDKATETVHKWESELELQYSYDKWDDAYKAGKISRQKLIDAYVHIGTAKATATEKVDLMDFQSQPGCENATAAVMKKYNSDIKSSGIKPGEYVTYYKAYNDFTGDDTSTKQEKMISYINNLSISKAQKDALYASLWKTTTKTFKNRPWANQAA